MFELRSIETKQFPLNSIPEVVKLVGDILESGEEPNIAFMSLLLGIIEHSMTVFNLNENKFKGRTNFIKKNPSLNLSENSKTNIEKDNGLQEQIPTLALETVELFYKKFYTLMSSNVDMKFYHLVDNFSPSGLVKRISDVVWDALTRTFYKDKNHLTSLYTMFTEKKMDCFGMSIGVLAGCQLLGLTDVNLVLTEDHSWAIFGPKKKINMEITWHGKGTEDKRGFSVDTTAPENSWVYAAPMICDRWMEFASIVVSLNPVIHSSLESCEIASLQKQILWLLYDAGHLKKYPMALNCLADLEEIIPTPNRPKSIDLYNQALEISKQCYNDLLIYPHTHLANYFYRRRFYKRALFCWANAAEVAGSYNYNREDDEMHREFYDVANEIIPNIIRTTSLKQQSDSQNNLSSLNVNSDSSKLSFDNISNGKTEGKSFLDDSWCFIDVLRFFDGMCRWEEGSSMPVLHIIWANNMTFTLTKFPAKIRSNVVLVDAETENIKVDKFNEKGLNENIDYDAVKNLNKFETKLNDKSDTSLMDLNTSDKTISIDKSGQEEIDDKTNHEERTGKPYLLLRSEKMAAIKDLFVVERLNTSAIKLQMTAQSQVATKATKLVEKIEEENKFGNRKRASDDSRNGSKNLNSEKIQLSKKRKGGI